MTNELRWERWPQLWDDSRVSASFCPELTKVILKVWPSSQQTSLSGSRHRVQTLSRSPDPQDHSHHHKSRAGPVPRVGPVPRHFGKGCPALLAKLDHSPTRWIHPSHLTDKQKLMLKNMIVLWNSVTEEMGVGGIAEAACFAGNRSCDLTFIFTTLTSTQGAPPPCRVRSRNWEAGQRNTRTSWWPSRFAAGFRAVVCCDATD